MGTGRKFRKKPMTRPIKGGVAKRKRDASQKKRLVDLGMDTEAVRKLDQKTVRTLLLRPKKIRAI